MPEDLIYWLWAFGGIGAAANFLWIALTERSYWRRRGR